MKSLFALLAAVANAKSDHMEFDARFEAEIAIQEGYNFTRAVTVRLTDIGLSEKEAGSFDTQYGIEIFIKIGDDTALKVETGREPVAYDNFESVTGTLDESEENVWGLQFTIPDCTIAAMDGKSVDVEAHIGNQYIHAETKIAMWKPADLIELDPIQLTAVQDLDGVYNSTTQIAACRTEGAYPAPAAVTISIGEHHFENLELVDNVATLEGTPQHFAPGREYDQQHVVCSFDILAAGEIMRKEVSQGGPNGTATVFSLQYQTTFVEISVDGTEEHNGEQWVELNSAVEIHCHADGNPHPSLTFNENGNPIIPDRETAAEAGHSLTGISSSSHDVTGDGATISCSADGYADLEDSVTIRAHSIGNTVAFFNGTKQLELVDRQVMNLTFTEGDAIDITCKADGWTPLASTEIHEPSDPSAAKSLQGAASKSMEGVYTCTASNNFSEQRTLGQIRITVASAPESGGSGGGSTIAIIIIVIVVLLLIAGVGFMVYKKKQAQKGEDGTGQDEENPEAEAFQPEGGPPRSSSPSDQ